MAYNSDNFDLKNWKLGLPVDSTGGISGVAAEIYNLIGYESPYFYDALDGAMVFKAMVEGATTKGSTNARSELREMNGAQLAAWNLIQGGTMTATLKIDSVPKTFDGQPIRCVIGQIHGRSDELVRLYWEKGNVYFKNDQAGANNAEMKFMLYNSNNQTSNISLGEYFSYKLDAHGDTLTVKVYADDQVYSSTTKINSIWQSDEFYFKAGIYLGANEGTSSGVGQISFYGLDFGHASGAGLEGLDSRLAKSEFLAEILGTSGSDNLIGTHDADALYGRAGNDIIQGRDGDDVIYGESGNDKLYGYWDNDTLMGGDGNDMLYGAQGDDILNGGAGQDYLSGGEGADVFVFDNLLNTHDILSDFKAGEDTLDIDALLNTGGIASIETISGKTGLYIDPDGAGSAHSVLLATFEGTSTADDVLLQAEILKAML